MTSMGICEKTRNTATSVTIRKTIRCIRLRTPKSSPNEGRGFGHAFGL
jgi:hypothetical protein